eukprot:TRINITY_DN1113_c1_g1_i5.p1 TRINITY_DN1113_c1_g1~~TRINITY_DN1113_c1_g1_i5.p1  ORF type:complete len:229 (+),score=10.22 TRINITY_DN1113_c1_g1_i5:96-689(+)
MRSETGRNFPSPMPSPSLVGPTGFAPTPAQAAEPADLFPGVNPQAGMTPHPAMFYTFPPLHSFHPMYQSPMMQFGMPRLRGGGDGAAPPCTTRRCPTDRRRRPMAKPLPYKTAATRPATGPDGRCQWAALWRRTRRPSAHSRMHSRVARPWLAPAVRTRGPSRRLGVAAKCGRNCSSSFSYGCACRVKWWDRCTRNG